MTDTDKETEERNEEITEGKKDLKKEGRTDG